MDVKMVPIGQVKPYEKNPRKNARAIPEVLKSLKEFGFRQPLVVDINMVLIVGHTRLAAAKKLKIKEVPVHVAELSEAQARAYRIMDNRSGERSEWEVSILNRELDELFELDSKFDLDFMDFGEKEEEEEEEKEKKEKKKRECPECGYEY
jgi:ParB-like chromosome segregation protein Spo0J